MDHRGLFKSKFTIRGSQADRRHQLQNKRALERDNMRNFGRDITMTIENSPSVSRDPNEGLNRFKQGFNIKYREILSNKKEKEAALTHWRPPFVSVVPIGKFIDPPSTTALSKRVTKTQENIQKTLTGKKVFPQKTPEGPRRSKRNAKRLNLNTDSKNNQFHDYVKKNGQENTGFTFIHSTVVKSSKNMNKRKIPPVVVARNFMVSDEDDLAGISPIEEAQSPVTPISSIAISTQNEPTVTQNEIVSEPPREDEQLVEANTRAASISPISILQQIESTNQDEILQGTLPRQAYSQNQADGSPSKNYISPFVTTTRGKCKRETVNINSSSFNISNVSIEQETEQMKINREAALKYENILNDEIIRLEELNKKWELYKLENLDLDDCVEMIDGTVGQTKLLISSKFQQFREVIDNCRFQNGARLIVAYDLEGFWDVVKLQVQNVDDRFLKLEKLRSNDWKEDVNTDKIIKKKKPANKIKNKRKSAISGFKDFIESMRQQKLGQANAMNEATTSGAKTRQIGDPIAAIKNNSPFRVLNSPNIRDPATIEINRELGDLQINSSIADKSSIKRGKSIRFVEPRKSSDSDVILVESGSEGDKENQMVDNELNEPVTPTNPKRSSRKYRVTPKISASNLIDTPQSKERRRSLRTPKSKLSFCDELHNCSRVDSPRSKKMTPKRTRRITALINRD